MLNESLINVWKYQILSEKAWNEKEVLYILNIVDLEKLVLLDLKDYWVIFMLEWIDREWNKEFDTNLSLPSEHLILSQNRMFSSLCNVMKSGDNKTSDFEKNYLQAGTVRLVNVVISYRFEHLFCQTYFMQGGTCGRRLRLIKSYL